VTRPIEQSLATLDHVEEITSVSRENASQVMLQLTDDANMDTLAADIREKLNAVSGSWDDMVGTPYIMKINPSMLPVTVAAVEMEGMDNIALTNLLDTELMLKLEGIEGVASVSASGNVQEEVSVRLRQDKIDGVKIGDFNIRISFDLSKVNLKAGRDLWRGPAEAGRQRPGD
jgi:multidrug efflux pump subunit AcrB